MKTSPTLNLIAAGFAVLTGSVHANAGPSELSSAGAAIAFSYDRPQGGALTCNGKIRPPPATGPTTCDFNAQGSLQITLANWSGQTAMLTNAGEITGSCRRSLIAGPPNSYNLTTACIPNDGGERKNATGERLVDEWFSDLPWHQKLSTLHSNLIDIPFVLPFAAIPKDLCPADLAPTEQARCMLHYGIVNVMAMHRTDTLYRPGEAPSTQDCGDGNCVELKIAFQRLHTQTNKPAGYEADTVGNNSHYISEDLTIPSLGFAITEATIFAPWRPWYMGHYCTVLKDDISDSVCYEDYFTTQLQAATNLSAEQVWLRDHPALFYPQNPINFNPKNPADKQFGFYCKTGSNTCNMFLGKVEFLPGATKSQIVGCKTVDADDCQRQAQEVKDKTQILDTQFKLSLSQFADVGRFPWDEGGLDNWLANLGSAVKTNPFLGYYAMTKYANSGTPPSSLFRAAGYALPKKCTPQDFAAARLNGDAVAIAHLKDCSANFEVHTNGFFENWKDLYGGKLTSAAISEILKVFPHLGDNQYGRTMFMYAGVPDQQLPVSFVAPKLDGGNPGRLKVYDKIDGASLYTQYLPMVNPDDLTQRSKYYQNEFWHAFFMSNHMNQTPDHFIRGIRGRTLWHNEYRSHMMYQAEHDRTPEGTRFQGVMKHVDFAAGFQRENHRSPFHGNTCDACHVRNGSGIPLMPNGKLPPIHVHAGSDHTMTGHDMKEDFTLDPPGTADYTQTNTKLPAMKLVLFDLKDAVLRREQCHVDSHTTPKVLDALGAKTYKNKIMNFYGNSFHVNLSRGLPTYDVDHVPIIADSGFEVVVDLNTPRTPADYPDRSYMPKRMVISLIDIGRERCTKARLRRLPDGFDPKIWPSGCAEVNGGAILKAIADGEIGLMHLLGKRLGNTPLIEMIPDQKIRDTQRAQSDPVTGITYAGCFGLTAGTRAGNNGATNYRSCRTQQLGSTSADCYLSRWGWIGDRASLEDQIANAAHVEENVSSTAGFAQIHPNAKFPSQEVRYRQTLCGPADLGCQTSGANSDLTEEEIRNMATYQRWIGIPQRSEYQVGSEKVQHGEVIFKNLGCSSCHVIDKIPFVLKDNMLPDEERAALKKLQITSGTAPDYPFVSYLGTDLLLHDMGYLSQVAKAPAGATLRKADGTIKQNYAAYMQPIRTPPLKGLRFNRFVTDSNHNSITPIAKNEQAQDIIPGCDFLLHDGRACDAIEAAYLHDGPAVKALDMIERLNQLSPEQIRDLRAFLYSL